MGSRWIFAPSRRQIPATAPSTRNVGTDWGIFVLKILGRCSSGRIAARRAWTSSVASQVGRKRTGATSFVTVGFCFGGSQSFLAAMSPELMLDGVVGFYGRLAGGRFGMPPVLDQVGEIRCPVLGLFGGADEGIPTSDVDTFDRLLDEHDVEHDIVIYPDAPHSFFDRRYEEHAGACSDAWRRVISFLEKVGAAWAA